MTSPTPIRPGNNPATGGAVGEADTSAPAGGAGAGRARSLSESTVVARAQDGDLAAFEQLVRAYEAELFRLGYRMLGDRGEAQDAVQDTLVLAWRRLPSLRDPQAFRAWIYQLMTHRCLNIMRVQTRRRTQVTPTGDLQGDTPTDAHAAPSLTGDDPAAVTQTHALNDDLTVALAALPADQRTCWVLHELHDLSYPAIAYAVGVPISTVRGRIARARAQLAKGMTAWR